MAKKFKSFLKEATNVFHVFQQPVKELCSHTSCFVLLLSYSQKSETDSFKKKCLHLPTYPVFYQCSQRHKYFFIWPNTNITSTNNHFCEILENSVVTIFNSRMIGKFFFFNFSTLSGQDLHSCYWYYVTLYSVKPVSWNGGWHLNQLLH